ncbi:hypothetical protein Trydic_g9642 [Trypoxylus dichotomus]
MCSMSRSGKTGRSLEDFTQFTPAMGTVPKLHNWSVYKWLISETIQANSRIETETNLERAVCNTPSQIQEALVPRILKRDRKAMPEIQDGQKRCFTEQEKALADTLRPNSHRNDLQSSEKNKDKGNRQNIPAVPYAFNPKRA